MEVSLGRHPLPGTKIVRFLADCSLLKLAIAILFSGAPSREYCFPSDSDGTDPRVLTDTPFTCLHCVVDPGEGHDHVGCPGRAGCEGPGHRKEVSGTHAQVTIRHLLCYQPITGSTPTVMTTSTTTAITLAPC